MSDDFLARADRILADTRAADAHLGAQENGIRSKRATIARQIADLETAVRIYGEVMADSKDLHVPAELAGDERWFGERLGMPEPESADELATPDVDVAPSPATLPLTATRLAELGHAPPAEFRCDPGCGRVCASNAGLSGHRRSCAEYQAWHDAHVHDVGRAVPAPLPEPTVDVEAERAAFTARRQANAREAADRHRTLRETDR